MHRIYSNSSSPLTFKKTCGTHSGLCQTTHITYTVVQAAFKTLIYRNFPASTFRRQQATFGCVWLSLRYETRGRASVRHRTVVYEHGRANIWIVYQIPYKMRRSCPQNAEHSCFSQRRRVFGTGRAMSWHTDIRA